MNKILIYGNSKTCAPCGQLKQYLDSIGEEYEFKDLADDDVLKVREIKKEIFSHFDKGETATIPVILIDENPKIVGFDSEKIDKINEYLAKR